MYFYVLKKKTGGNNNNGLTLVHCIKNLLFCNSYFLYFLYLRIKTINKYNSQWNNVSLSEADL